MTTSLDDAKTLRIDELARQGAELAESLGANPGETGDFLAHYFRHVDSDDLLERAVADLLGLVGAHYRLAMERPAATAKVAVSTPRTEEEGWSAEGATVIQVITDDKPFLVDTVTMEVNRNGWSVREVYHPQFTVRRDVTGHLQAVVHTAEAAEDPTVLHESWMHLEIQPGEGHNDLSEITDGLHRVLRDVEEAVEDWGKMRERAEAAAQLLVESPPTGYDEAEVAGARELLTWVADDNFTFQGYREYKVTHTDDGAQYLPVAGTGLGILRSDNAAATAFHAVVPDGHRPTLLVITKNDTRSTIHRPAYLDYLGLRILDDDGTVIGERRFVGLFGSSAYTESVTRLPVLRDKARTILERSGYDAASHGGKAIMAALDNHPRDELFQTSVDELAPVIEKVARLKERRQIRMFTRRDPFGRFVSCLVYMPRDRYSTAVRSRIQARLLELLGGETADFTVQVSESVLARLFLVVRAPAGQVVPDLDVAAAERELTSALRSWNDDFSDEIASQGSDAGLLHWSPLLPEGYKEDFTARQAMLDLAALEQAGPDEAGHNRLEMALYAPERAGDEADLRFKIFRRGQSLSLSNVLPHLTVLGVDVIDERPYGLSDHTENGERSYIYDFGLKVPGGREAVASVWTPAARERFMAAFAASWQGQSEPDAFNALVMSAGLTWQQAGWLRAIARYLRQTGTPYSQSYIATSLRANTTITRTLVDLFEARFDPKHPAATDHQARIAHATAVKDKIIESLADVTSLDHDRIIRSFVRVLQAVIRTNAFQADRPALTLKLLPRKIPGLPEPRPAFELFVHSARVEGVHMRFGSVARGGLRWSDRAEDYRTEVLGLVKAQMVKNTVIVPVGAKGGFSCKRLPDPAVDRDAWLAEGVACYQIFINSLLDVTDSITDGEVIAPVDVVRYDDDDPYLVVAADKGTATFSDTANKISVDRGFWMGDAFASGGSAGYDHKGMGITAKGAWESVIRHFREMGRDCQSEDFTAVGIGDMSGDVFGNGMLLSRHTRLVAAFNHLHIFIDPEPDAERSFAERQRLFNLPRSTWADYDASLISAGGGIFDRTVKSIMITDQMRSALGIAEDVVELSPTELISAILTAPVDLLWNGGIGTYVKASSEPHGAAGDRANDVLRVDGKDLRARCVGEGGNLGFTQLGRIEYAAAGGRINTDFIDNSAGVGCSDLEVNIKILLGAEVNAGRLSLEDRNTLLASMTDEVSELVLAHNYDQNLALANGVHQSSSMAGVHEDWMTQLEEKGLLDRGIEFLPDSGEMANRRAAGRGLTAPELATLLAYTKIVLSDAVIESDLPDDPYLADRLINYFPSALRERYADRMPEHRLHREIIATVAVNEFVDTAGITCWYRLNNENGATPAEVMRAHLVARQVFGAAELEQQIRDLDQQLDAQVQTVLRMEVRTLVERATRWFTNNLSAPLDVAAAIEQYRAGVSAVREALPELLVGKEAQSYRDRLGRYTQAGVPQELAETLAVLPEAYSSLTVVQTANREGVDVLDTAAVHVRLGDVVVLDQLLNKIVELPREDRWQTMARAALRDDLHTLHGQLTAQVLSGRDPGRPSADLVEAWQQGNPKVEQAVQTLQAISTEEADIARVSVGLRVVRGLLPTS
ncbi:NAD-glutamate dehydrogenase [Propionibacteriaceae bacterium Y1700]|uniref:NAD-glutamate dehydrogenase n=1 Tax=Microlunatus sp. Y1700 TaxID=3418487 RepID=UPI003DA6FD6A